MGCALTHDDPVAECRRGVGVLVVTPAAGGVVVGLALAAVVLHRRRRPAR